MLNYPRAYGFFYVLDRKTGEFISGAPFVSGITWATRLDRKTGRPIEVPGVGGTEPTLISPDPFGAHNLRPHRFDRTNHDGQSAS